MDNAELLARVDHTLLSVTATWDEIRDLCDDGIKYGVASVCIPPCYVERAKNYVGDRLKICTVIGFPNGYNTKEVKVFETEQAVKSGADEIDMVVNQGDVKSENFATVLMEINAVKAACKGKILKVIVETCNLDEQEKIKLCKIVEQSDADFIKTSTGFASGGATFEDIALFAENIKTKKIKAAGGISSLADGEKFISLGAERLGTSRIVKLIKGE